MGALRGGRCCEAVRDGVEGVRGGAVGVGVCVVEVLEGGMGGGGLGGGWAASKSLEDVGCGCADLMTQGAHFSIMSKFTLR